ncbi:MAG: thioredoxin family protein [Verrucomicrobiales bacterium]|nr:thioredoxin family protein [Verrucomicrobiales bacterium]
MLWFRRLAVLAFAGFLTLEATGASATSARLLLPVQAVRPGDTFVAAIRLESQPGWHTYWKNGGDSGAPTTAEWKLPTGFRAGDVQWPAPERFEENDLVTYVHHGVTLLHVPISVAPGTPQGPVELYATVKWLECKTLCVQGKAVVRANLTVAAGTQPSSDAPSLDEARAKLPRPLPADAASATWDGPPSGDERPLVLRWSAPEAQGTPDFYPSGSKDYEISTATERLASEPPVVLLRKKLKRFEGDWPTEIAGLFVVADAKHQPVSAFEARLRIDASAAATLPNPPPAPAPAGRTAPAPTTAKASPPPAARSLSFAGAIGFGFLGGLILNIMPCVLPVIALKILGFVRQSRSHAAETRKLGVVYGLGVWFSFLVLAGTVIAVKRAAGIASWGMQFGNPVFLVILTTLILLVALSLFGVYEINLGGGAMDAAGDLATKEGTAGAFFNGMLAVALATPCTAPFLAPALGYAFTADSFTVVLVFSAVAFGLAAPYVVLSWKPEWLRFLPKPGNWMVHFKVAMGFPMLATALWLYTLAARHFGDAGPWWLGVFLVGIALSAWVWGEFAQRGRKHQTAAVVVAIALAGASYAGTLERELHWRSPRPAPTSNLAPTTPSKDRIPWQPWSRDAVDAARKTGRVVFVDFTADWCLTCKVNERSSIEIDSVRDRLRSLNAITLKGDHTLLPPAISEELQRHGRAGVPLVLVYPRDASKPPAVLPEVLTPGVVLDALEAAAR